MLLSSDGNILPILALEFCNNELLQVVWLVLAPNTKPGIPINASYHYMC